MDYHSMKRRELQALCKKHNIPANSTNSVLADKLSELLNERLKPKARQRTCIKSSVEKTDEDEPALSKRQLKKVRFSPNNDLVEYEPGKKHMAMVTNTKVQRKSVAKKVDKSVICDDTTVELIEDGAEVPATLTRSRVQVKQAIKDVEKGHDVVKGTGGNLGRVTRSKAHTSGKGVDESKPRKRAVKDVENANESVDETVVERVRVTRSKAETKRSGKQVAEDVRTVEQSKEIIDIPVRVTRSRGQTLNEDFRNTVNDPSYGKKRSRREMKLTDTSKNLSNVAPEDDQKLPKRKSMRTRGVKNMDEDETDKVKVVNESRVTRFKSRLANKSIGRNNKSKTKNKVEEALEHAGKKNVTRRKSVVQVEKTEPVIRLGELVKRRTRQSVVMEQSKVQSDEVKENVMSSRKNASENERKAVSNAPGSLKSMKHRGTVVIKDQIVDESPIHSVKGNMIARKQMESSLKTTASRKNAVTRDNSSNKRSKLSGAKHSDLLDHAVKSNKDWSPVSEIGDFELDEKVIEPEVIPAIDESHRRFTSSLIRSERKEPCQSAIKEQFKLSPHEVAKIRADPVLCTALEVTSVVDESRRRFTRSAIRSERKELSESAIKEQYQLSPHEVAKIRADPVSSMALGRITRSGIKVGRNLASNFSERIDKSKQASQSAHQRERVDDGVQISSPEVAEGRPSPDVTVARSEIRPNPDVTTEPQSNEFKESATRSRKNASENERKAVSNASGSLKSKKRRGTVVIEDQTVDAELVSPINESPNSSVRSVEGNMIAGKQMESSLKTPASRKNVVTRDNSSNKRSKLSGTEQSDLMDHTAKSNKYGSSVLEIGNIESDEKVIEPEVTPAVDESRRRFTRSVIRSERIEPSESAIKEQYQLSPYEVTKIQADPVFCTAPEVTPAVGESRRRFTRSVIRSERMKPSESAIKEQYQLSPYEVAKIQADPVFCTAPEVTPAVGESRRRFTHSAIRRERKEPREPAIREQYQLSPHEVAKIRANPVFSTAPRRITRSGIKVGRNSLGNFAERIDKSRQASPSAHQRKCFDDDAQIFSPEVAEVRPSPDVTVARSEIRPNPDVTVEPQSEIRSCPVVIAAPSEIILSPDVATEPQSETRLNPDVNLEFQSEIRPNSDFAVESQVDTRSDPDLAVGSQAEFSPSADVMIESESESEFRPNGPNPDVTVESESEFRPNGPNPDVTVESESEIRPNPEITLESQPEIRRNLDVAVECQSEIRLKPDVTVVSPSEIRPNLDLPTGIQSEIKPNPDVPIEIQSEFSEEMTVQTLEKSADLSALESVRFMTEDIEEKQDSGTVIAVVSETVSPLSGENRDSHEMFNGSFARAKGLGETPSGESISNVRTPFLKAEFAETIPGAISYGCTMQDQSVDMKSSLSGEAEVQVTVDIQKSVLISGRPEVDENIIVDKSLEGEENQRDSVSYNVGSSAAFHLSFDKSDVKRKTNEVEVPDENDIKDDIHEILGLGKSDGDDDIVDHGKECVKEHECEVMHSTCDDANKIPTPGKSDGDDDKLETVSTARIVLEDPALSGEVDVREVGSLVGEYDAEPKNDDSPDQSARDDKFFQELAIDEYDNKYDRESNVKPLIGDNVEKDDVLPDKHENMPVLTEILVNSDLSLSKEGPQNLATSGNDDAEMTCDARQEFLLDINKDAFISGLENTTNFTDTKNYSGHETKITGVQSKETESVSPDIHHASSDKEEQKVATVDCDWDSGKFFEDDLNVGVDVENPTKEEYSRSPKEDLNKQEENQNTSTYVDWGDYGFQVDEYQKPVSANESENDDHLSDIQSVKNVGEDSKNVADDKSNQEEDLLKGNANVDMREEIFNWSDSSLKSLFSPATSGIRHLKNGQDDADLSLKTLFATPATTQISHLKDVEADAVSFAFSIDGCNEGIGRKGTPTNEFNNQLEIESSKDFSRENEMYGDANFKDFSRKYFEDEGASSDMSAKNKCFEFNGINQADKFKQYDLSSKAAGTSHDLNDYTIHSDEFEKKEETQLQGSESDDFGPGFDKRNARKGNMTPNILTSDVQENTK